MESNIQASELRIGNYILDDDGSIVKVECIESTYFNNYDGGGEFPIKFSDKLLNIKTCDLSDCSGIPLTEEILLKCPEFKQCSFRSDFRLDLRYDNAQFHIVKHNKRFIFRGLGMSIVYVDTLHHLQNLVFVNTGKELEFNL